MGGACEGRWRRPREPRGPAVEVAWGLESVPCARRALRTGGSKGLWVRQMGNVSLSPHPLRVERPRVAASLEPSVPHLSAGSFGAEPRAPTVPSHCASASFACRRRLALVGAHRQLQMLPVLLALAPEPVSMIKKDLLFPLAEDRRSSSVMVTPCRERRGGRAPAARPGAGGGPG